MVVPINRKGEAKLKEVDYLIDLAAYGNYHFQDDVEEIFKVNVMRLIKIFKSFKVKKGLILTSSASVQLPVNTFYGASKLAIESLGKAYNNKLPVVTLRPSTIIGVNEAEHHLVPTLIKSCYTSETMDFTPRPSHDFLSVEDYVDAVLLVMKNISKLRGKVLNVGSGKSLTNLEMLKLVEKESGYAANIRTVNSLRPQDVKEWVVKPAKELKDLGWKPKVKLSKEINRMIADFRL